MKNNPQNEGIISENFEGVGTVSREMIHERAAELALIGSKEPGSISQDNYQQAKRELTGESDIDRQEEVLNSFPESKRWDPVPGTEGRETPGAKSDDEDDDGESEVEQLVEQGAEEAAHDQMLQAAKETDADEQPIQHKTTAHPKRR